MCAAKLRGVIALTSLTRSFGDRRIVSELSLAVDAGERAALRGPNGSGKTTLLRCLLGTLTPDSGTVTIGGHPAGSVGARRLTGASLSQERSFYLRLSGRDNLLLHARLRGLSGRHAKKDVEALIDELELDTVAAQRTDRCSTGQLQQLAFARALLGHPLAILLDEPTRSLDTDARNRLWDALDRRPHAAVVVATHIEEDVARCTGVLDLRTRREDAA